MRNPELTRKNHTSALQAPKSLTNEAFQQYNLEMARNPDHKSALILMKLGNIKPGDKIVDIGCCNGQLLRLIAQKKPYSTFIGVDLSTNFLEIAVKTTVDTPNVHFICADGNYLPFKDDSIQTFILSSLLHDIFSYGLLDAEPFAIETVAIFLSNLKMRLKAGGSIIIKDPAKPENPDEELFFLIKPSTGYTSNMYDDLTQYPVAELSVYGRYVRFLHEFVALQRQPELQTQLLAQVANRNNTKLKAPAWVLSEFLRHRNLCATDGNWDSEMLECYGVCTLEEFTKLANKVGLNLSEISTSYNPKNHSAIINDEICIWDIGGQSVSRAERLPTTLEVVLTK